jgi:hypothetical protein
VKDPTPACPDDAAHRAAREHERRGLAVRVERHELPAEPLPADAVVMVRPACFGANPETAGSNAFQAAHDAERVAEVRRLEREEADGLAAALRRAGVRVVALDDLPERACPDAVFPNNWVTLHADGTAILYPMQAESRRREVRFDLFGRLEREGHFVLRRLIDLRPLAQGGLFLEGTGSLVLDRPRRLAYACLSPRTSPRAVQAFASATGWSVHAFHAADAFGRPIYHTNVMLALGEGFAVCCLGAVSDAGQRTDLRERLAAERELVEITREQMEGFAANLLALRAADGRPVLALSERALGAFTPAQRTLLASRAALATAPIPTLERHGGGSARCTLLEAPGAPTAS